MKDKLTKNIARNVEIPPCVGFRNYQRTLKSIATESVIDQFDCTASNIIQ